MTWDDVIELAKEHSYLYYKAPLDYRSTMVEVTWSPDHPDCVTVIPPIHTGRHRADIFLADSVHLLRFSRTR